MSKRKDENRKGCRFCRFMWRLIKGMVILMLGICIGIHWKVIRAWAEEKGFPKVAEIRCPGCCCHRKK